MKALIASRALAYPKLHDISSLVSILGKNGEDLSAFSGLEDYTIFAVQYRYEAYDESEEPLDRHAVANVVGALLLHVAARLDAGGIGANSEES